MPLGNGMPFRWPLFEKFNLATASPNFMYGRFSEMRSGRKPLKTSGSSTTVTAVTAGDGPFDELTVGDQINVNRDGTVDTVYIATIVDADNGTVTGSGVDWTTGPQGAPGRHFQFRRFQSGTGATAGWFDARNVQALKIQYILTTLNGTSITFQVEGRIKGAQQTATIIDSKTLTAAGSGFIDVTRMLDAAWDEVRVGAQIAGDSGTNDISVYALGVC